LEVVEALLKENFPSDPNTALMEDGLCWLVAASAWYRIPEQSLCCMVTVGMLGCLQVDCRTDSDMTRCFVWLILA
jgi:hypothetical protein